MTLSNVLADLLSPQGSHGQKAVFLETFLSNFNLAETWAVPIKARVATEVGTRNGRRIDIRIDFEQGVIAIENKPWAADQELQVADYIAEIEARHPHNRKLIYLSADGDGPGEYSTGKGRDFVQEGTLQIIGYGELLDWLVLCKGLCKSLRIVAFLDEFSDYISREFKGINQMHEREMIVSEVTKNADNLEAAFMVGAALNDVKVELLGQLWGQVKNEISKIYPAWKIEGGFTHAEKSKYQGVSISVSPSDRYKMMLQFQQNNCNECIIGVVKSKGNGILPERPEITKVLKTEFATGESSPHWPWYRNFEPKRWGNHSEIWNGVLSGTLSQKIFSEFQEIYRVLEKEGLLAELN